MKRNKIKYLINIFLILGFLILASLLNSRSNIKLYVSTPKTSAPHAIINIEGNAELDAFFLGDGTDGLSWETAYIIANYEINGSVEGSIIIRNTDRYLIIKECFLFTVAVFVNCLALRNCKNIRITDNRLDNPSSLALYITGGSSNITISGNIIDGCDSGIKLRDSSNNLISKNTITNGNEYGIALIGNCDNNIITENTITNNGFAGIYLDYTTDNNEVFKNCIKDNDGTIDDRGENNCYDNNNCPMVPGYSIAMIFGTLLATTIIIIIAIRKKSRK